MRELHGHKVNECNEQISLLADDPGPGGAPSHYRASWPIPDEKRCIYEINFQHGPIKEVGTNGLTHEVLLTVIEDRLKCYQNGPYACPENGVALAHIQAALAHLKARTATRVARGVEGTHKI